LPIDSPVPPRKCRNSSVLLNQCSDLPTSIPFVVPGTSPPYIPHLGPPKEGRMLVRKLSIPQLIPEREIQKVECPLPPINDAQLSSSSPPPQTASQQARKSGVSIPGSSPPPPLTPQSTERKDLSGNKITCSFCKFFGKRSLFTKLKKKCISSQRSEAVYAINQPNQDEKQRSGGE